MRALTAQLPVQTLGLADMAAARLRLSVRLRRAGLDRQIAAGLPLTATRALRLRARQLVDPRLRRELARDLRRTIDYAERCEERTRLSAVMLIPGRVRGGRGALLRLADRLEQEQDASPQGVALVLIMLTDGESPLFDRDSDRTVTEASCIAEDALLSGEPAPAR